MEKEFEDYWLKHQKRLILKSPKNLREEYLESTRLDTPMDWVCFVLPIAVGIILQPRLNFESEILSWGVVLLVVVVLFALLQMVKPYLQKKKTTIQALDMPLKIFIMNVIKNMVSTKLSLGHNISCDIFWIRICRNFFTLS